MSMAEAQARAHLVAVARSQLGYTATSTTSKYGVGANWPDGGSWVWQGLWCARGVSWFFAEAFGVDAARAGIGRQPSTPLPAGWAATWLWRDWLRTKGLHVGFANARPGDIIFYRFPNPGGGRGKNPTNHVSLVASNRGSYLECIGPNTPRPGTGGDPTAGAGVWLHKRYLTSVVVAVYRADWAALLNVYNATQDDAPAPPPAPEEEFMTDAQYKDIKADIADLRKYVGQRTTVNLSQGTANNLATGQTVWSLSGFLNLVGNRVGRTDQRVHRMPATILNFQFPRHGGGTHSVASVLRGSNSAAKAASSAAQQGLTATVGTLGVLNDVASGQVKIGDMTAQIKAALDKALHPITASEADPEGEPATIADDPVGDEDRNEQED